MESTFKIEKGIPIPERGHDGCRRCKYGWEKMEIGDSQFFPGATTGDKKGNARAYAAAKAYAARRNKRFLGRRVTVKGVTGVRIWRIE